MTKFIVLVAMSFSMMACATMNSAEQERGDSEQQKVEQTQIENSNATPPIALEDPADSLSLEDHSQEHQEAAVSHEVAESSPAPVPMPELVEAPPAQNIATSLPAKKEIFPERATATPRAAVARYSKSKSHKVASKAKSSSHKKLVAKKSSKKSKVAKKLSKAECKKVAKNPKKHKKEIAMCKIQKKKYAKL